MKKDHFNINILSIFMQKILQEMAHRFVRYVPAYDDMPIITPTYINHKMQQSL